MKKKKRTFKTPPKPKKIKQKFRLKEFLYSYRYIFLIIFLGFLLRVLDLGRQGLWIDEMCCWNDSQKPAEQILKTQHDTVFLLERLCMNFGGKHEFFLRFPSALGGLIGLIFIYPLALLLFDNKRAALLALVFLVFSPINIYYSQDANYYGLMMGVTVASLYFLFLFMKTYNPIWLIPFILMSYINFHVHPATLLLMACQIISVTLFFVTDDGFRKSVKRKIDKITTSKFVYASAGLAGLFLVVILGWGFFRHIYRMAIRPYGTVLAENLEFSPRFFIKLAMDYGVAFQEYKAHVFFITLFFLFLFFLGLVLSFKKQRYFAFFVILTWTFPFIAIYIKKVGHFYHCRYTSFIVPGYLILAAYGVERLLALVKRKTSEKNARFALVLVACVFCLAAVPNLFRYYTGHKQDWKGAVSYLKKNLKPGEKVATNHFCNDSSLEFYFDYFKMDPSPIVKLAGEFRGASYTGLFRLKKLCFTSPGIYFGISYTRYENQALWNWVKTYFETAFNQPSLHPEEFNREGKEVILYKFKYSGSFVFPPYHYSYKPDQAIHLTGAFEKEIFFGADGFFKVVFECAGPDENTEYTIEIENTKSDNILTEKALVKAGEHKALLSANFRLKQGVYMVRLKSAFNFPEEFSIIKLAVLPEVKGTYHREVEDTDLYHPTPWKRIESTQGARAFTLERNNYVWFDRIPISRSGRHGFLIRALEDKPGPALVEVSLDWKPLGILSFPRGDNTWSEKTFSFHASKGEHSLSFHFLSPPAEVNKLITGKMSSNRNEDTDLVLDYFEIRPLEKGEKYPDLRVPVGNNLVSPVPSIERGFQNPSVPDELMPNWRIKPAHIYSFEQSPGSLHSRSIMIEVPYESKGFIFISPPFPVQQGKFLYFSTWLKTQNLINHAANMKVVYIRGQKALEEQIVNADGITKTTDWIRQVYLRLVPKGADKAIIVFWVYPNSRRPSQSPGYCCFDPVRFEKFPESRFEPSKSD